MEVNKPESVHSETIISIAQATGWIAHLRRSPHISSMSIKNIHTILKSSSKERSNFLRDLGTRVFRDPLIMKEDESQEKEKSLKGLWQIINKIKRGITRKFIFSV